MTNSLQEQFIANLDSFNYFEAKPRVAVAISGGIDSTSLLLLTNEWAKRKQGTVVALTVNHQLRDSAAAEVIQIAGLCATLGIKHITLVWQKEEITYGNLQAKAREARYKLLTNYCLTNNIIHLLVAHHLEDRIENLFIRMLRGSGIFGLTENSISYSNNIRILRPLYNITKAALTKYLQEQKVSWCEDETNSSPKYLRNRIRQQLPTFSKTTTLTWEQFNLRLGLVHDNLQSTSLIVQKSFIKTLVQYVQFSDYGSAKVNWTELEKEEQELQFLVISYVLTIVGGQSSLPRSSSLKLLLKDKDIANAGKTLHGCYIIKVKDILYCCRDFGRYPPMAIKLINKQIWDHRFQVSCETESTSTKDYTIDYLTLSEYNELNKEFALLSVLPEANIIKKKILFTLPVVKYLEKVVTIPHINYYKVGTKFKSKAVSFNIVPSFTSRLTHF